MKKLLSPGIVALLLAISSLGGSTLSGSQDRHVNDDMRDRFVGAWRLVSLEEPGADGTVHPADCTGMLVFTREGRMSVQIMYSNPQAGTSGGPVQYAQGGYEASFGRYEVGAGAQQFTYHVEGALVRSLVGKDLTRRFELSGTRLIVRPASPDEHWRVTWEHY
jgi:hypothetical protein